MNMGAEGLYRGYMGFIWENRGYTGVMGFIQGLYRDYIGVMVLQNPTHSFL